MSAISFGSTAYGRSNHDTPAPVDEAAARVFRNVAGQWVCASRDLLDRTDHASLLLLAKAAATCAMDSVRGAPTENRYDPSYNLISPAGRIKKAVRQIETAGELTRGMKRSLFRDVFSQPTEHHDDAIGELSSPRKTVSDDIVAIADFFYQQSRQPGFTAQGVPEPERVERMIRAVLGESAPRCEQH